MRWQSQALLQKFKEKYEPILEQLGWKAEVSERVIRHIGGLERAISIAIFRDGHVAIRHLVIQEVIARDSHWIRVASTYNSTGVVSKNLEQVWKGFYSQLNKIVASCVLDLIHEVGSGVKFSLPPKFSLAEGLELEVNGAKIRIPVSQISEAKKIIALSAL